MRTLITAILLLLAVPLSAAERIDLRILYCGNPGSAREADFRALLEAHFTKVSTGNYETFTPQFADDHDVVIFDWTDGYDGNGAPDQGKWKLAVPTIDSRFTRPTILIGRAGGKIALPLKLKIDWLCLCLDGPAHNLKLDHPVFRGPLPIDPRLEEIPTRPEYPYMTLDPAPGRTMKVWRVQTRDYPAIDPGLVSTLYGFEDSPDAEIIAQGVAGKGPDSVALARHANYFLWGFSAAPADMTPDGRRLFVNVVAYMRQFDGQAPLVRKSAPPRQWALRYAAIPRYLSDEYRQMTTQAKRAAFTEHPDWVPEKHKGDVDAYVAELTDGERKANAEAFEQLHPADLRKRFGLDPDKYTAYYRENLEYLRPAAGDDTMSFIVDEEVKSIATSNRSLDLLDRCVAMLERDDRPDLALRLLKRYTGESFQSPLQWRNWLTLNRARLFFSDAGGYRFFVAPPPPVARPALLRQDGSGGSN